MKKEIGTIAVGSILMISTLFSGCGFFSDREGLEYESDGQFHYYGGKNGYAIIGEEDNLPETVYVTSHYKGKEIVSYKTRYTPPSTIGDGHEIYYHLYLKDVKRVYFPYNCDSTYFDWSQPVGSKSLTEQFYVSDGFGLRSFIERADDLYFLSKVEIVSGNFFVREKLYNKCMDEIPKFVEDDYKAKFFTFKEGKYSFIIRQEYRRNNEYVGCYEFQVQVANTSYLFNYEGSPNEGYFFINDFQYGGKIEDTPYEPMREGYTFDGWYREPECRTEWDFEKDTLPEAEYDEDGSPEFTETKLYAKWLKE